jgi:hypothetical protein
VNSVTVSSLLYRGVAADEDVNPEAVVLLGAWESKEVKVVALSC